MAGSKSGTPRNESASPRIEPATPRKESVTLRTQSSTIRESTERWLTTSNNSDKTDLASNMSKSSLDSRIDEEETKDEEEDDAYQLNSSSEHQSRSSLKRCAIISTSRTSTSTVRSSGMAKPPDWQKLHSIPVFSGCGQDFLHDIVSATNVVFFQDGQVLLEQGEDTEGLFIVLYGTVEVSIQGVKVEEGTEGSWFGEQMVFGPSVASTVTVKATTTAMLKKITREDFHEILERHPEEKHVFATGTEHLSDLPGSTRRAAIASAARTVSTGVNHAEPWNFSSLCNVPMFRGCDAGFLRLLELHIFRRTFFSGQAIFREGSLGETCIIINQGCVRVDIAGRFVADLKGGSMLGEIALLGVSERRVATVTATQTCHVSVLHRKTVQAALEQYPKESTRFGQLAQQRNPDDSVVPAVLRSIKFFKMCSERFVSFLSQRLDERLYMPQQVILTENTESDAIYIISHGKCETWMSGVIVAELDTGDVFGEMSMLQYADRTTSSVRATTTCFMQVLHRAAFLNVLETFPEERDMFLQDVHSFSQRRRSGLLAAAASMKRASLSEYRLFSTCSMPFLERVEALFEHRLFLPGEDIITEGDDGDTCFILVQGTADALRNNTAVSAFKPGSLFGEFAMLGLSPKREATIRASMVCLVEQLRGNAFWELLNEFPSETVWIKELVLEHLEFTVHDTMIQVKFFSGMTLRLMPLITAQVRREVMMPEKWLSSNDLTIIHRGIVEVWKDDIELGNLASGAYFGSNVALGIHRVQQFSYRTQSVCHILSVDRTTLMSFVHMHHLNNWLEQCRERELVEFDAQQMVLRERMQKARMQDYLVLNPGMFPTVRRMVFGTSDALSIMSLRACFHSWLRLCALLGRRRSAEQLLHAASQGVLCPTPAGARIRRTKGQEQRRSVRGGSRGQKVGPPTPFEMLRLPPLGSGVAAAGPVIGPAAGPAAAPAVGGTEASAAASSLPPLDKVLGESPRTPAVRKPCEWGKELRTILSCRKGQDLYDPREDRQGRQWVTDALRGFPRIPTARMVTAKFPPSPSLASRAYDSVVVT